MIIYYQNILKLKKLKNLKLKNTIGLYFNKISKFI